MIKEFWLSQNDGGAYATPREFYEQNNHEKKVVTDLVIFLNRIFTKFYVNWAFFFAQILKLLFI